MIATTFPEANDVLKKPGKMTHEQVAELPVWIGMAPVDQQDTQAAVCVSCWVPNKEDIEAINAGKPIYLISQIATVNATVNLKNGATKQVSRTYGGINMLTTESPFKK